MSGSASREVVLTMVGGKKGLLENSADLCAAEHRAKVAFRADNGRVQDFKPVAEGELPEGQEPQEVSVTARVWVFEA